MIVKISTEVDIEVCNADPAFIDVEELAINEARRILTQDPGFYDFKFEVVRKDEELANEKSIKNNPVLKFIRDFINAAKENGIKYESLRKLFEDGYCYYFAYMLYHAFDRGEVCICAPYGHCVWKDIDGEIYDFHGISDAEYEVLIPVKMKESHEIDFKHIETNTPGITMEELIELMDKVKEGN